MSAKSSNTRPSREQGRWNPYWVGVSLGVLSWIAFGVLNQPLGISTSLSAVSSVCAIPLLGSEGVAQNAYWSKTPLKMDGGMLFLMGTFLGSLASVIVGRTFQWETVPLLWEERFGKSSTKRFAAAFGGGMLLMYGARMAGGCTSGHGISGTLQLALSSWLFFLVLFATGAITAAVMWRRRSS